MNKLYSRRTPLVILISGSLSVGKSLIATSISDAFNVSNIVQTKVVVDVLHSIYPDFKYNQYMNENLDETQLIESYLEESKLVRKGCNFDVEKAFVEGKAVIIEGHHIIPSLFITKENNQFFYHTPKQENETARETEIREEMEKVEQKGIIVPVLLTTQRDAQLSYLRKVAETNKNIFRSNYSDLETYVNKVQIIQNYLIKSNEHFIEIQINYNDPYETIKLLHKTILEQIEIGNKIGIF